MQEAGSHGEGLEPENDERPAESEPIAEPVAATPGSEGPIAPDPDATTEPVAAPPTLDDLLAGIADESASAVASEAGTTEEPETPVPSPAAAEDASAPLTPLETEEPAEGIESAPAPKSRPVVARVSTRAPFWVLGALWACFAGVMTYLLWPLSDQAFVDSPLYAVLVFGGAALVILGFVVGLVVWLGARPVARAAGEGPLGLRLWARALGWTAGGVVLWWVALIALDLHRTGVIG